MLGSLMPSTMPWGAPNAWTPWLQHIMKPAKSLALKKAAIVQEDGTIAAATPGFSLHPIEVKLLLVQFDKLADMPEKKPPMIVINDKTYLVKSADEHHIVAWNGKRYFIVCHSNNLLLIALCHSKNKVEDAASWMQRINKHIMESNF